MISKDLRLAERTMMVPLFIVESPFKIVKYDNAIGHRNNSGLSAQSILCDRGGEEVRRSPRGQRIIISILVILEHAVATLKKG